MIREALARKETSCVGIAWVRSAKEKTGKEPRWHRITMNSYGKEGYEWQGMAVEKL